VADGVAAVEVAFAVSIAVVDVTGIEESEVTGVPIGAVAVAL
jgi:hypothetical protein